jgi:hypothetical protein
LQNNKKCCQLFAKFIFRTIITQFISVNVWLYFFSEMSYFSISIFKAAECHFCRSIFVRKRNKNYFFISYLQNKKTLLFMLFIFLVKYLGRMVDIIFRYFCFRFDHFRYFCLTLDIDRSLRSQMLQKQNKKVIWKKNWKKVVVVFLVLPIASYLYFFSFNNYCKGLISSLT